MLSLQQRPQLRSHTSLRVHRSLALAGCFDFVSADLRQRYGRLSRNFSWWTGPRLRGASLLRARVLASWGSTASLHVPAVENKKQKQKRNKRAPRVRTTRSRFVPSVRALSVGASAPGWPGSDDGAGGAGGARGASKMSPTEALVELMLLPMTAASTAARGAGAAGAGDDSRASASGEKRAHGYMFSRVLRGKGKGCGRRRGEDLARC